MSITVKFDLITSSGLTYIKYGNIDCTFEEFIDKLYLMKDNTNDINCVTFKYTDNTLLVIDKNILDKTISITTD